MGFIRPIQQLVIRSVPFCLYATSGQRMCSQQDDAPKRPTCLAVTFN